MYREAPGLAGQRSSCEKRTSISTHQILGNEFGDELDAAAGRRFRECVLEPGAAAGGAAMMEAFLGRPFREDAYFERLGVPVSS